MNRPFSIARGTYLYGTELMEGEPSMSVNGKYVWIDCQLADQESLTFNTCLTDHNGKEIFTGDTLRKYNEPHITVEVVYLPVEGAFYLKREETGVHYSNRYPDPTETRIDRTDIIYQRLTQRVADCYVIVAYMQDDAIPPIDEHDELFDPPPPTVEGSDA